MVAHGRPWEAVVDHGRPWSSTVDHGRPWLSLLLLVSSITHANDDSDNNSDSSQIYDSDDSYVGDAGDDIGEGEIMMSAMKL